MEEGERGGELERGKMRKRGKGETGTVDSSEGKK